MTFPLCSGFIVYSDDSNEMCEYVRHTIWGCSEVIVDMYKIFKYPTFFENTCNGFIPLEDPVRSPINMRPGKELDKRMECFERKLDEIQCDLDTRRKMLT